MRAGIVKSLVNIDQLLSCLNRQIEYIKLFQKCQSKQTQNQRKEDVMWISKKKWNGMEKRIADLEKRVQAQPKEIIEEFAKQLNNQMSKRSVRP